MKKFNFQISHKELFHERPSNDNIAFSERSTVKIVLMDNEDNVCLIARTGSNFYLLPGGGIEKGEDPIEALKRECLEEAGCAVANEEEIGTVIELREEASERRIVTCYKGKLDGQKHAPTLAADDIGFDVVWLNVHEAISKLEDQFESISEQTDNFYARKFNSARDLRILQHVSWSEMATVNP